MSLPRATPGPDFAEPPPRRLAGLLLKGFGGLLLMAGLLMAVIAGCRHGRLPSSSPASAPADETSGTSTTAAPQADEDAATTGASIPTTAAPAGPEPPAGPAEQAAIGWEALSNLTLALGDQLVELRDGEASVSYGGESEDRYELQNRVVQGDLNGDGTDDVVVHVIMFTAGTGTFHLIVPVINDAGNLLAQTPTTVGDRVVMDEIRINDGKIEVSLFDRGLGEPFIVITQRKTLQIDPATGELRVVDTKPIEALPLPRSDLPDIRIQFEPGAVGAAVSGSIEFSDRQTYLVNAEAGQAFTAAIKAPVGIWLDMRLDGQVIASAVEHSQSISTTLPATGEWRLSVLSAHDGPADYELAVTALPLGTDSDSQRATPAAPIPISSPSAEHGDVIHLTFDDGPSTAYTPKVLDVLARYDAKATFFVLGSLTERHPDLARRITDEGHTLANHTWNHEDLSGLPQASFDGIVSRTQAILGEHATPCLRPPYGSVDAFTEGYASAHGLELVMWTVDTKDWLRPGARTIANRIIQGARNGAIVLMHDGGGDRSQTVQALEIALERLSELGLRYEPLCTPVQPPPVQPPPDEPPPDQSPPDEPPPDEPPPDQPPPDQSP